MDKENRNKEKRLPTPEEIAEGISGEERERILHPQPVELNPGEQTKGNITPIVPWDGGMYDRQGIESEEGLIPWPQDKGTDHEEDYNDPDYDELDDEDWDL